MRLQLTTKVLRDHDVGTPIPDVPEAVIAGFDLFFTMIRFARLLTKAFDALFSISATLSSTNTSRAAICMVNDDLERWRQSIPEPFRPGGSFHPTRFPNHVSMRVALRVRLYYCCAVIAVSRISLHFEDSHSRQQAESKMALMNAARDVVELTRYIDAEPYTPAW